MLPMLEDCDLDITYIVAPSQSDIPRLYRYIPSHAHPSASLRGHDVFLFTSRYEAWGMPVLEAMASGLPIVTTDCFGVRSFATHGINCLMADPTDLNLLAVYVIALCKDPDLRSDLAKRARESAKQFSLERVVDSLEAVLYSLTACSEELQRIKQASLPDIQVRLSRDKGMQCCAEGVFMCGRCLCSTEKDAKMILLYRPCIFKGTE